jgi:hypothetical protein
VLSPSVIRSVGLAGQRRGAAEMSARCGRVIGPRGGRGRGEVAADGTPAAERDHVGMGGVLLAEPKNSGTHLPPVAGDVIGGSSR